MSQNTLDSSIQTYLPSAARGDRAAYEQVVRGCQGMVTSIAWAIVRDVPASEDIAQEAFLSAWQNLRKLGNPSSFLPWLRQITRNLARDHLRSQSHRANPAGDIDALIASVSDPAFDPEHSLAHEQDARIAAAVIDALPEESRETLLLYYREGQSSKQVAALLGMQDSAVRKRLSRARQSVRQELLQRLGDYARHSAPTAAFTAAVLGSLVLVSPPAAAAMVLGTGGAWLGKGSAKLALASVGSACAGIVGPLVGVWTNVHDHLQAPLDARERRGLICYGLAQTGWVVGLAIGVVTGAQASDWKPLVFVTLLYVAGFVAMREFWLPRILARLRAGGLETAPSRTADAFSWTKQLRSTRGQPRAVVTQVASALTAWRPRA